jgi:hypothetical protein
MNDKSLGGYKQKRGVLCIFTLMLEPCSHKLGGLMDAGLGSHLCLRDGPL